MAVTKVAIEKLTICALRIAQDSPAHAWVGDSFSLVVAKSIMFQLAAELPNRLTRKRRSEIGRRPLVR